MCILSVYITKSCWLLRFWVFCLCPWRVSKHTKSLGWGVGGWGELYPCLFGILQNPLFLLSKEVSKTKHHYPGQLPSPSSEHRRRCPGQPQGPRRTPERRGYGTPGSCRRSSREEHSTCPCNDPTFLHTIHNMQLTVSQSQDIRNVNQEMCLRKVKKCKFIPQTLCL